MLVVCAGFPAALLADESKEQVKQEILILIEAISGSGCEFERNGSPHDAESAANHLRLKYRRGKRYADTTVKFIERLASGKRTLISSASFHSAWQA